VLLWIAAIAILLAGLFFASRLVYALGGMAYIVRRSTVRARDELKQELAKLSTEKLSQRLLQDSYLSSRLLNDVTVKEFLARVARGDEVALAREYSGSRLYRFLANAERSAGGTGRPEAVDAAPEISAVLQVLASRRARNEMSGAENRRSL
jgi:hypothetical protein